MSDHPPQLEPYINVLGRDLTLKLIMELGGAPIYLPADPKSRSRVAMLIGRDKAIALASELGSASIRIPNAKKWAARELFKSGVATNEIARRLRVTDVTIRRWRKADQDGGRQPDLFSEAS